MGTVTYKDNVPVCDMCGELMTEFDGWAWHTCPNCGNMVRIFDDDVKWEREVFGRNSCSNVSKTCICCGKSLSGGELISAWENGNNPDAYIKCPNCGSANFIEE